MKKLRCPLCGNPVSLCTYTYRDIWIKNDTPLKNHDSVIVKEPTEELDATIVCSHCDFTYSISKTPSNKLELHNVIDFETLIEDFIYDHPECIKNG